MKIQRNRFEINFTRIEQLLERAVDEFECGDVLRLKADGFQVSLMRYSETNDLKEQGHRFVETADGVSTVCLGEAA